MAEVYRTGWMDRYFVCAQVTSISTSGDFSTHIGLDDSTDYGLLLLNHPDIDPGMTILDQRKAIGQSVRSATTGHEYTPTIYNPTVTLEMEANAWNVAFFSWLMFQKGTAETDLTGKYSYVAQPPTVTNGADFEVWCSVVRDTRTASKSQGLHGGVVRSMTISGSAGESIKLSVDIAGRGYGAAVDASSYTWTPVDRAPLLFQNITATLAGTPLNLDSFSITYNNGLIAKHYDSANVTRFLIGDCTASGSFTFPWGTDTVGQNAVITSFLGSSVAELIIGLPDATADTAGDLVLNTICRYSGPPTLSTEDELMNNISFEAAKTSGAYAYKITSVTDVTLGVPA